MPIEFSPEELSLFADAQFFRQKAVIINKMRNLLAETHSALKNELATQPLVVPSGFNLQLHQIVKGEHLEDCPYQYLDYPKHFDGLTKWTFRTLFWWGHHLCWALLLEGAGMRQYKKHVVDRFHRLAGMDLELSIAPTLWEWKRGEGYTLPIRHDRKAQIAAVLAERSFMKVVRCMPLTDPRIGVGDVPRMTCETFRSLLPIVAL